MATSTPLPEQGGFNERLDEAFGVYLGGTPDEDEWQDWQEFKVAIRTLVLEEIIGEPEVGMQSKVTKTENGYIIDEWGDMASGFRNTLRDEQRKKLEDTHGTK